MFLLEIIFNPMPQMLQSNAPEFWIINNITESRICLEAREPDLYLCQSLIAYRLPHCRKVGGVVYHLG